MRENIMFWQHMTAAEIAAIDKQRAIALLPVSATEQHGPHLSTGVDAFIGADIIGGLAELDGPVIVLPAVEYGSSDEHANLPGTLSVPFHLSEQLLMAVCQGVARSGFRRILLFNTHGGNYAIPAVVRRLRIEHGLLAVACYWADLVESDGLTATERCYGVHAGRAETSLMLHTRPESVRSNHTATFSNAAQPFDAQRRFLRFSGPVTLGWRATDLNPHGASGDASASNALHGASLLKQATNGLTALLNEMTACESFMDSRVSRAVSNGAAP